MSDPVAVTVCEMPSGPAFEDAWTELARHVHREGSDVVVLPETPFAPWLAAERRFDAHRWEEAVAQHRRWLDRLPELGAAAVVGTRPVQAGAARWNEAFCWTLDGGYEPMHAKTRLPAEEGCWETSWFDSGTTPAGTVVRCRGIGVAGLICSELWFGEHARRAGRDGAQLLVSPRATALGSTEKWLVAGRAAALVAGAFSLSSNRAAYAASDGSGTTYRDASDFGGCGWIVSPDGAVLACTSPDEPFVTRTVSPAAADAARHTYPRTL